MITKEYGHLQLSKREWGLEVVTMGPNHHFLVVDKSSDFIELQFPAIGKITNVFPGPLVAQMNYLIVFLLWKANAICGWRN
jgi:hypothetical protein